MHDKKPSKTAYKVALNILTLGAKPDMVGVLPPGLVDATEQLLIASGAASAKTVRRSRSARMARVYEALRIVAEGLLQYLEPQAVRGLFAQCASIAGDSRIAFTYIPTREDGRPDAGPRTQFVLWPLKVGGEPW